MIVCHKPWTVFDVDLVGAAGVGILLLASAWLVVLPWQRTWSEYQTLAAAQTAAEAQLHEDAVTLDRFGDELEPLDSLVKREAQSVPQASALPELLRRIADTARESNLELMSVTPQPVSPAGAYLTTDIQFGGRGASLDFIRFLDQLARENPYQALQTCAVSRSAGTAAATCEMTWALRLFLLPAENPADSGGVR